MPRPRMSVEAFIQKAKKIHGDTYDYRSVKAIPGSKELIKIHCKEHGVFEQTASNHCSGRGCVKCGRVKTESAKHLDTKEFLKRAKEKHGKTYTYEDAVYTGTANQISITCRIHGKFSMQANNHMNGKGCRKCADTLRGEQRRGDWYTPKTLQKLVGLEIEDGRKEFNKYAYVNMVCGTHGKVSTQVQRLVDGAGCPTCSTGLHIVNRYVAARGENQEKLVERMRKIYGEQYTYEKVDYLNATTKITVTCVVHGDFRATPNQLTSGYRLASEMACKKCRNSTKEKRIGGRLFEYRGYEILGVQHLVTNGVLAKSITTKRAKIPRIDIAYKKKCGHVIRTHFPDIYVKSENLLVEVKSPGTFGFTCFHTDSTDLIRTIQTKSKSAKAQGYDYRVFVFKGPRDVTPIELPTDWDSMKVQSLRKWWRINHQKL